MRYSIILTIAAIVVLIAGGCGDIKSNIVNPTDQEEPIPAVKAVFAYLEQNYPYMITYPNDMKVRRVDQDPYGWWHVRLNQYYKNIRILHAESIAHVKPDLTITGFVPSVYNDLDINTAPDLLLNDAVAIAVAHQEEVGGQATNPEEAELVIYPDEGNLYLSWFFYLTCENTSCNWHYYINAVTGEVIYYWDGIVYN